MASLGSSDPSDAVNDTSEVRRPLSAQRTPTAPPIMSTSSGMIGGSSRQTSFEHGIQVIDGDKNFSEHLLRYLQLEDINRAGFNYHLISVFGSQSTGKSTLLNHLFGTEFGVMSEQERRQTTKGIWMSKNKRQDRAAVDVSSRMADNILVMDVEGTDGRERGEDQDFERKAALFALATSEVLIVNIWEHQVGLYQGANMGLLKTVFEVNLQLFLKDAQSAPRSLLFFVIRDHIGNTPLVNLRQTLLADLSRIWSSLSKPDGLEDSKIEDYFDFAFVALPHKILQPDKFAADVQKLSLRFREGYVDPKHKSLQLDDQNAPILLPEYHRKIPADGFPIYAQNVWQQIDSNKDLDLPTQQELLAQFRCDEIAREVMVAFDKVIDPLEGRQSDATSSGNPVVIAGLGFAMNSARSLVIKDFQTEASRYHKGVYNRKAEELISQVDSRLRALFSGQLTAAHAAGVKVFSDGVTAAVKAGQTKGATYDFRHIVETEKVAALEQYENVAKSALVEQVSWGSYQQELALFRKDLERIGAQLRRDELRRLASRIERWIRSRLDESIGTEFNKLGSGRGGSGAPENGAKPAEKQLWDRIWSIFVETVSQAGTRFTERAQSLDASLDEVEIGLWRLRRKSWTVLRAKIDEETMDGNLLLKLREHFEDHFRYGEDGIPRIWRPSDDIEGSYSRARERTLQLLPLLSKFKLAETSSAPPLDAWIGAVPSAVTSADEEDLAPIGGVSHDAETTLDEEMTILGDSKRQDVMNRFKKTADGIFVEAKRGALGGVTQIPLYFYGLLLALGWNEIVSVLRNPVLFVILLLTVAGGYVTYNLNLWGPIIRMAQAASEQGLEVGKERLREFLAENPTARQAIGVPAESVKERDTSARQRDTDGGGDKIELDEI